MADIWINVAGYGGMISALLWLGILPYLLERKRAEQNGEKPPSFAGSYLTTMIISAIGGFITLGMAIGELEKAVANATTLFTAAGIGFSFTYTVLGISNQIVDLKLESAKLKKEITLLTRKDSI